MTDSDPFASFETQRTLIKPRPRTVERAGTDAVAWSRHAAEPEDVEAGALNPLVSAAGRLLALVARLRAQSRAPDVPALRVSIAGAVQRFDAAARRAGVPNETVLAARYVLCTALDESVANTPWGAQTGWNKQSLLVQFHNETWGGEKVFQLLAKLAQDVPAHRDLLELIYCVLALGFEGRYRVLDNGRAQLDAVRQRLADLIRAARPMPEAGLSPHWHGQGGAAVRLHESLPLRVIGAGLLAVLALVYFGLRLSLNHRSDAIYAGVSSLRAAGAVGAPPAAMAGAPRLARFLEPEIRQGLVTVTDETNRSVVRLRGDSVFGSGSAEPSPQALPVLRRIGQALAQVNGEVLIAGHSDSQPVRSMRYPSNWHLSAARADAVKAALSGWVDPGRLRAEGKADAEPVVPNDTPANRARNRRVDIVLLVLPGHPADAPPVRAGR